MKLLIALVLFFIPSVVASAPRSEKPVSAFEEQRYCGAPARLKDGSIRRRADVLSAYKRVHPCPANGSKTGSCPGWAIDHVIPLACGGCDAVSNLQWLPNEIKSCSGDKCKDRFERKIYCNPG